MCTLGSSPEAGVPAGVELPPSDPPVSLLKQTILELVVCQKRVHTVYTSFTALILRSAKLECFSTK